MEFSVGIDVGARTHHVEKTKEKTKEKGTGYFS